jgi:hypothetical protein
VVEVKLTDAVDTSGHGFREIEERNRLKAAAEAAAKADLERRAYALADAVDGIGVQGAIEVLRVLDTDPGQYLHLPEPEVARPVKVKQTTGMIRTIRTNMRDLLLGYESLSRVLPETERTELRDPIFHAVEALELMGRPA